MNLHNSTNNCKSCHYYHGENNLICSNHPSGPPEESYCPDYQKADIEEDIVETNEMINFVESAIIWSLWLSFLGATWFGLTSISLASATYSFKQWGEEKPFSSIEAQSFNSHLYQASHGVFWGVMTIGLSIVFLFLIVGGGLSIIILLWYGKDCLMEKIYEID